MSQDKKKTQINNALQESDLSNPFKICWQLKNEGILYHSVASDKNTNFIFASTVDGIIKSLDSNSGEKRWETDLGGEIISAPYIDGENVYIVSQPNEKQNEVSTDIENNIVIRSLSILSGVIKWQTNLKSNLNSDQISLYIFESTLLIANRNGNLHAVNKNDGGFNWQKTLDMKLSAPPYFYADKAIFGTFEKQLIILKLAEGKTYKKLELRVTPTALSYNIIDKTLIVGDQEGRVTSLKIEKIDFEISKKKKKTKYINWEIRFGAEVSNIGFTPKGLFITSLDNFAYLISKERGKLIWKKRLLGRISEQSLVLDNYALITTTAEPTIYVFELNTGKLVNKIILGDGNFVTANPIVVQNKIIVLTSKGLYAYSLNECHKIEN